MSSATPDAVNDAANRVQQFGDATRSAASSMAADAQQAMGTAGEAMRDAGHRAGEFVESAYHAGRRTAASAVDTAYAYPIATFLVGVVAGWILSSLTRNHR